MKGGASVSTGEEGPNSESGEGDERSSFAVVGYSMLVWLERREEDA